MWKGPNSLMFMFDRERDHGQDWDEGEGEGEGRPSLCCRAEAAMYRPSGPKLRPGGPGCTTYMLVR